MVLMRALLALWLTACIKTGAPVQAPGAVDVASTVSLGTVGSAHGTPPPPELRKVLGDLLAARRLNLQPVDAPADFLVRRSTPHRLAWLAAHNGNAPVLLLMELNARRYDNLGGRFRWVVDVKLTLSPQGELNSAQTVAFAVPVHLGHAHSNATDATRAAMPTLKRRLAAALDSYLAGSGAP